MNRFFTLLLAASCLTAVGQVPDYVPTNGLVGWWPYSGNLMDQSNNGLHASNFGSTFTIDRFGTENSALDLDGDSWVQATIPQTHAWSVSIWANQLNANAYNGLVQHKNNCVRGGGWLFSLPDGSNDIRLLISNCGECSQGSCSSEIDVAFPSVVESTSWHHFVASRTDEGVYRVYLDGTLIHELTNNVAFETYGEQPFSVGKHHDGSNLLPITGSADDVGLWSRALTPAEVEALFLGESILGCTDALACNYNSEANLDDGTCASCEALQTACGPGTIWDAELQMCIGDGSGDINLDGCVQLNDLLDLLTAYGDCGAEESAWQCGDPLEYQGYDYATVLIGEQCWFAENLRAENYRNGDAILGFADREWSTTTEGGAFVYGEGNGNCNNYSPDGDACDESWALDQYGRLYNWYAVDDTRSLCPIGWHIPSDAEWTVLNDYLGGDNPVNPYSWGNAGAQMKTDYGWAEEFNGVVSGTNSSGFSGLPGGSFWPTLEANNFSSAGYYGTWWSSSPTGTSGSLALTRSLTYSFNVVNESSSNKRAGYSVRCVQDAE